MTTIFVNRELYSGMCNVTENKYKTTTETCWTLPQTQGWNGIENDIVAVSNWKNQNN